MLLSADSDSITEVGPKYCVSNKLLGEADLLVLVLEK